VDCVEKKSKTANISRYSSARVPKATSCWWFVQKILVTRDNEKSLQKSQVLPKFLARQVQKIKKEKGKMARGRLRHILRDKSISISIRIYSLHLQNRLFLRKRPIPLFLAR